MPAVVTNQLTKSFGDVQVLDGIDLSVPTGSLTGFLGPNGAGKSTTIRILLGLLSASSGTATIFEKCCRRHGPEIRRQIGYLPGDVNLYSSMTGRSLLTYLARSRRVNCESTIDRLAESFELPLRRRIRSYSTGMKQKLGLIQALMHEPDLLVLDEPTSALDPLMKTRVFEELRSVVAAGRTILFSSHSLDEVEELCDEVIILRDGTIVEQQKIETLRQQALRRISIEFRDGNMIEEPLPKELLVKSRDENRLLGMWSGTIEDLLVWIRKFSLDDLTIEKPDLGDLFLAYYSSGTSTDAPDSTEQKDREHGLS